MEELRAQIAAIFAAVAEVKRRRLELNQALGARTAALARSGQLQARIKAHVTAALGIGHAALDAAGLRRQGGARELTAEEDLKRQVKRAGTMKLRGYLTKAEKKERTFRGSVTITTKTK